MTAGEHGKESLADRMKAGVDAAKHSMEEAAKKTKEGIHDLSKMAHDGVHDFSKGMHDASDTMSRGISDTASKTHVGFRKSPSKATAEPKATLDNGSGTSYEKKGSDKDNSPKETKINVSEAKKSGENNLAGREVTFANKPQVDSKQVQQSPRKLINSLHWIKKKYEPILAALISVAVCQVVTYYQRLLDDQLPIFMAAVWILIALIAGGFLGRIQAQDEIEQAIKARRAAAAAAAAANDTGVSVRSDVTMEDLDKHGFSAGVRNLLGEMKVPKVPWTSLKKGHTSPSSGGQRGTGLVSMSTTKTLFGLVPREQRKSLRSVGVSSKELQVAIEEDEALETLGNTVDDPERLRAKSLEQDYVEPICTTRGLDVFTADCPENDLATHPFLVDNGVRDCPTFILNLMTQWGNVSMYFKLPDWVEDWDNLPKESPDDPEDVRALKRFLGGDDEYRSLRLKVLPVLVDGPGPIRFVAPPRSTVTIVRDTLPAVWTKFPAKVDASGNVIEHCCLEMDGDLMSAGTMRAGAALIKRYLGSIIGDCALLIEKPYLQEEEEPRACLGLCRFDHIDISGCPDMPPRLDQGKTEEERDMLRASVLAGRPLR